MPEGYVPSSSRTDSPIVTLVSWFEYWRTIIFVSSIPSLYSSVEVSRERLRAHRSATAFARAGWLLPVKSLMELDAMPSMVFVEAVITEEASWKWSRAEQSLMRRERKVTAGRIRNFTDDGRSLS